MKWTPVVTEGGTLPPELAKKLRHFGITGEEGANGALITAENPTHYYIQGLAACGVEGASMLDSALNRFEKVRIKTSGGESDEEA